MSPRPIVWLGAIAALMLASAGGAEAQSFSRHISGSVVFTQLDTEVVPASGEPSTEGFSGAAVGFQGVLSLWRLELGVRYLYGGLDSDQGDVKLDFVEAEFLIGYRPIPWFTVKAGPHARAFESQAGTERWLFWELRARAQAALIAPQLGSYVELWGSVVGDVNFGPGFGGGRGLEAGLSYEPMSIPLWGRISYRIDRGTVSGGSRSDSVQEVLIGLGFGWR